MNRRFYCAVGVASGVFLLGGGVAEAGATAHDADRNIDPKATSVLPTDIFTPTGGQHRLVTSIGTLVERANTTSGHGQAEIQPNTESLGRNGMSGTETSTGGQVNNNAGAGRAELLPSLGGGGGAGTDALLGLLGGLPGGSLLGKLTDGGPLGQLLGSGPLGNLLGGPKNAPADGGAAGAATANPPRTQDPAIGSDVATDWRQARPAADRRAGERPIGATGSDGVDPALSGAVANPAWRLPALNQPATRPVDDATATRGRVAGEQPASSASHIGDEVVEKQSATGGNPLAGGVFGPLGRVQIVGGDSLAGLPVVGDLLGEGLSLDTLNKLAGLNDLVKQMGSKDSGEASPALGNLPVGNLSRMLLGGESATSGKTEAAATQRSIDKAKVTPKLQALLGPDALGIHQLQPAG